MAKPAAPNGTPEVPPPPPWERTARKAKAPARTPLSQEAIVATALRVLESDGYEALSMRRVAADLGTGAASLYAHVANKEELLRLCIDRVFADVEFPPPDPDRWVEQLRDAMRETRRILQAHPGLARALLGRVPMGPNGLRLIEGFMGVLRLGELPDRVAAWAGDVVTLYVVASVFEDDIRHTLHGDTSEEDVEAWAEEMKGYIKTLPAAAFPNMLALADPMFETGGPDGRFEFGLDLMLRGLASHSRRGTGEA
ncbi:transcriptional regulator, TetR family [Catenulispora acidiphila DSM 44928]|uniref:Transcriptional regulator, TetR family n=1 Tax=Catenulispora acidiphila (strain DSM 44928 / JCM 14897 / NBRC 102108 / NRRL B-24433 / ID139908) TaxID=479433 RepID=C7QE68_CATAD|nr:TetR/AcrR family transcriptional regulator [Catenulispora acidiphila]ACU76656.1 transcriptional regulator, TetR family [Catenulispora acidiphila DSM 44928]